MRELLCLRDFNTYGLISGTKDNQEILKNNIFRFLTASDVVIASEEDQEHLNVNNHKILEEAIIQKLEELSWTGNI